MFMVEDEGSMFPKNIGECILGYAVSIEGLVVVCGLSRQVPG
jgi:hypothetical protein